MGKLYIFFTLSFIVSISAYAQDLRLGFTKSNSLVIRSEDCQTLEDQSQALCRWKEKLVGETERDINQCIKERNGFRITINKCLPDFTKSYQRKPLFKSGANCWGTAMSFKNISSKPRFVWSREMHYWLSSPLCRKLSNKSDLQAGDIINTYGPEYIFEENDYTKGDKLWDVLYPDTIIKIEDEGYSGFHHHLHSETYISDKLSFGKDSPNKDDRFDFHQLKEVYGRSRVEECQENQSLEANLRLKPNRARNLKSEKCAYFSNAYRCEDFLSFFSKDSLNEQELEVYEEIKAMFPYQELLFKLTSVKNLKLSQSQISDILSLVKKNRESSLAALKAKPYKKLEMLLVWKYFTGESLQKALELASIIPATERL